MVEFCVVCEIVYVGIWPLKGIFNVLDMGWGSLFHTSVMGPEGWIFSALLEDDIVLMKVSAPVAIAAIQIGTNF